MTKGTTSILRVGLVTAAGIGVRACAAAFRAKVSNPSPTRVTDSFGDWIVGHQVPTQRPGDGAARLAELACMAIADCIACQDDHDWNTVPVLLCLSGPDRLDRAHGLDESVSAEVQRLLGIRFARGSGTLSSGRAGVFSALAQARKLIGSGISSRALIVAADSLLQRRTLETYDAAGRLLTPKNSNGFVPGEAAGALLVGNDAGAKALQCWGIGLANEPAHLTSGAPLRGDGLSSAMKAALQQADLSMHNVDYRVADLSGEHYFFKEAALALSRTLRQRKEELDLWHPAECFGEVGAAAGVATIGVMAEAAGKGYAPGPIVMAHCSNDDGLRAAAVFSADNLA